MWTYEQQTGDLYRDGKFIGTGYSGAGKTHAEGRNNPDMQGVRQKGPIPVGFYRIGKAHYSQHCGPVAMDLTPEPGTNTFGRSAFLIHGDNANNNASKGCIILAKPLRNMIDRSHDQRLQVVREHAGRSADSKGA